MSQDSQNPANVKKPKLLDQVRNALRTKHYSMKTEEAYIHWIKKYIFFHNKRHPKEMGEKEINQLKNQINQLNSQSSNLNNLLLEKDNQIAKLNSQLMTLKSSSESYQNQITQLTNEKNQLESQTQSLKQQLQQMEQDVQQVQQQNMALQQQLTPLQQKITQLQQELSYKDKRIQELKEPKAVMPSTLAQQSISSQAPSFGEPTSYGAPSSTSFDTTTPSPALSTDRRVCPSCGASGFAIKEVEDRSKIVSYIPKPIYAKKKVCTKCGYEF